MAVQSRPGKYPHIFWMDLRGNNVFEECVVMKKHPNGDITYIPLKGLDSIDQSRLLKILRDKTANMLELWELMKHHRLGNGVNALIYFNQMARTISSGGMIVGEGQRGGGEMPAVRDLNPPAQQVAEAKEAKEAPKPAPKKRGRKPKVKDPILQDPTE